MYLISLFSLNAINLIGTTTTLSLNDSNFSIGVMLPKSNEKIYLYISCFNEENNITFNFNYLPSWENCNVNNNYL